MLEALTTNSGLFWLMLAAMFLFTVCWTVVFVTLRTQKDIIESIFIEGNLLRILTVVSVVVAITFLAIAGALKNEAIAAIFSGIVGYVLGVWYHKIGNRTLSGHG